MLVSILLLAAFVFFIATKRDGGWDWIAPLLSCGNIVSLSVSGSTPVTRLLSSRPMIWIGATSYSIYMVHMAVVWAFNQVVRFALHAQPVPESIDPAQPLLVGAVTGNGLLLGAIAATLLLSLFTFKYVEVPLRDWSKAAWPAKRG